MTTRITAWTGNGTPRGRSRLIVALITGAAFALVFAPVLGPSVLAQPGPRLRPPELTGGGDWFGIDKPLQLKDLRGKIVLIDFWTSCCINCMQTLPDIAKLEAKYSRQLVVIGIHTPKFENERSDDNVRQAMRRYEINHPVLNDPDRNLWRSYGAQGWPTLILIDPEGFLIGRLELERPKNYGILDQAINQAIRIHRAKKTLNEDLLPFQKERAKAESGPLYFPGRVLADDAGDRLFIADSTHHRILVTDFNGRILETIGSGTAGKANGSYQRCQFNEPQGLALRGNTLFVADRRNHLIRAVDLKDKDVRTIAGIGRRGAEAFVNGAGLRTALNSPWGLLAVDHRLFIANSGSNQLRLFDFSNDNLSTFAGTANEDIIDGARSRCSLAQPSGLTTDGKYLFWVDSETSSVRYTQLDGKGPVRTLIGRGLFEYGDRDGGPDVARLQHPMDLVFAEGKLYVADTYNDKIKEVDPQNGECNTLALEPANSSEMGNLFDEPGGISYAEGKLYVADTNAHRIRVVDLKTKKVSTLTLTGIEN
jgi:thiol-disulfide isomerase/thioredoxin